MAAPADKGCSTTQLHAHHKHRREVVYDYAYVTVTVDGNGSVIGGASSTQDQASTSTGDSSVTASQQNHGASRSSESVLSSGVSTEPGSSASSSATTSSASSAQLSLASSGNSGNSNQQLLLSSSASQSSSSSSSSSLGSSSLKDIIGDLKAFQNPSEEFQDGTISCSDFPTGQGVIRLDHLGFGGWSGIENSDGSTGGNCKEGSHCSYACQAGMSKTQYPSEQPSSGVSIGGLLCKNGKLHRTNTNTSYLCEWGEDKATVVSELSDTVAICRTDYPGTENMVIPTVVEGGDSSILTVVNSETYYKWKGKPTTAQYYVNDAGVPWTTGCTWGNLGSGYGNWAPLNFGAGYSNGVAYLSLIPNPNNKKSLNFKVKIVPDGDDSVVSGNCTYEDGKYNGDGTDGCTVGVTKGKAKFVLYK